MGVNGYRLMSIVFWVTLSLSFPIEYYLLAFYFHAFTEAWTLETWLFVATYGTLVGIILGLTDRTASNKPDIKS